MRNPVRLTARGVRHLPYLLKRTVIKAWEHRVLGLSAEAAFWQLLSLPSLFLAVVATLGYVSRWFGHNTVKNTETTINRTLSRAFSHEVTDQVIAPTLHEVLYGQRADVISIGFVLALWAGSSATATFVNTITIAYDMRDLRGPVRSRLLALWVFLGTVVLGVIVLPLLVLGPDLIIRAFPHRFHNAVSNAVDLGYYPLLVFLLLLGLTTFYHLAPPRRLPWYRGLPGAILAIGIFLGGSMGLRGYLHFILDHNHAYTALAAPIAALLFFFVLALGVLLGAEFNAAIEQFRPTPIRPPRVLDPKGWRRLDAQDEATRDVGGDDAGGTRRGNGRHDDDNPTSRGGGPAHAAASRPRGVPTSDTPTNSAPTTGARTAGEPSDPRSKPAVAAAGPTTSRPLVLRLRTAARSDTHAADIAGLSGRTTGGRGVDTGGAGSVAAHSAAMRGTAVSVRTARSAPATLRRWAMSGREAVVDLLARRADR